MPVQLVPYGLPAREALRERLQQLKAGDPLAPVTVLVPSNYAGLSLRRALAAREPVVNVRFMVPARLAELLGAPALTREGRRPLTPWLRLTAVRVALAEQPGVFGEVASHPSTARELGRVFEELRPVESELEALARSSRRAADVVALYRRYRELTAGLFDEVDLMDAAARAMRTGQAAAREAGPVILYLPRKVSAPLTGLLQAAAQPPRGEPDAIIGVTGDPDVDARAIAMARTVAGHEVAAPECALPFAERVISATDPEEEVREATRQAMALLRDGMPLHRIAFVHASSEVYSGLLHDALVSAGLPHNGDGSRRLSQTIAGRTVLGLPRIGASTGAGDPGYARDVVMDWLTSAPIWHDGREAPSHRWDDISREAGVVRGPGQWATRLELYAKAQEEEAGFREAADGGLFRRNAEWARSLARFMATLTETLGGDARKRMSAHAVDALKWLDSYLPERALQEDEELEAREQVKRLLEEIAAPPAVGAGELDPAVSRGEFALALEEALWQSAGRVGSLGEGVFTGTIETAAEMDFDAVLVLGMVEGTLPAPARDDPILTAADRASSGQALAAAADRTAEQRRAYLATLHGAGRRFVSYARGDLRNQRATQPSRWLLESARALAGDKRIYATELGEKLTDPPPWFRVVHSFEAALRTAEVPASPQEWDLGSLLDYQGRIDRHFLMAPAPGNALARGALARRSRQSRLPQLDGWSGRVPAGSAPIPSADRAISPTALEQFAACPFRYFLGNVLKVGEIENPEEVVTIQPATIGNIVHEVLQAFFERTAARADPFADWTADERELLRALAAETFRKFEQAGLTGKELTWRAEQARIRRDLELLLDRELRERRKGGFRFQRAEAAFGLERVRDGAESLPAATIDLPDGGRIAFRGRIDRVDVGPNGELLVTDYKTGSTSRYKTLTKENPLQGGKFLQLPVYALAFKEQTNSPVRARYWFISEQADFESKEVVLNEETYRGFRQVVATLVETMRSGCFPAVPGGEEYRSSESWANCVYCPYDRLCPSTGRSEAWEAAKHDPALIPFASLAENGVALEDTGD